MRQINFIENPANRTDHDRPIMSVTAGQRWDSVFIEVSLSTYITQHFRDWLDNCVFTRLMPGGNVRIAIVAPESALDN